MRSIGSKIAVKLYNAGLTSFADLQAEARKDVKESMLTHAQQIGVKHFHVGTCRQFRPRPRMLIYFARLPQDLEKLIPRAYVARRSRKRRFWPVADSFLRPNRAERWTLGVKHSRRHSTLPIPNSKGRSWVPTAVVTRGAAMSTLSSGTKTTTWCVAGSPRETVFPALLIHFCAGGSGR